MAGSPSVAPGLGSTCWEATMAGGEWGERQLCHDRGCIGVIGPDGHCRVCGRAASDVGDAPPGDRAAAELTARAANGDAPVAAAAGVRAEREHCPDASCTGSVGPDGRCEV